MNAYNEIVYKSAIKRACFQGTPVIRIEVDSVCEASFGYMTYFFEKSCAVSGLLLGISPIDQPGVEIYKAEMRRFINSKL
jgi:glucose-6-phosphate isomerase